MAKLKPGEKRVQLSFQRPEDLRLYEFMQAEAYRCRWDLQTFVLASLTEAFKDKMEEYEVEALAQEAATKVRERTLPDLTSRTLTKEDVDSPEFGGGSPQEPPKSKSTVVSMDEAAKQAEAQIAQLDALAAKTMGKRKIKGSVPPMPK